MTARLHAHSNKVVNKKFYFPFLIIIIYLVNWRHFLVYLLEKSLRSKYTHLLLLTRSYERRQVCIYELIA